MALIVLCALESRASRFSSVLGAVEQPARPKPNAATSMAAQIDCFIKFSCAGPLRGRRPDVGQGERPSSGINLTHVADEAAMGKMGSRHFEATRFGDDARACGRYSNGHQRNTNHDQ